MSTTFSVKLTLTDTGAADQGADLNPTLLFMDPRNRNINKGSCTHNTCASFRIGDASAGVSPVPAVSQNPSDPSPQTILNSEHGTRIRRNATDFMLGYDLSPSPTSTDRIGEVSASQRVEILRKGRKRVNVAFSGDGGGWGGGGDLWSQIKRRPKRRGPLLQ
jgi:hypothetical protein